MKLPKKITAEWLEELGANEECPVMEAFTHEWPDGARVTKKNALRAREIGLRFKWLADRVFPAPVLAQCVRVHDEAFSLWEADVSAADALCDKRNPRDTQSAKKAWRLAERTFAKTTALAFWRAWREVEKGGG